MKRLLLHPRAGLKSADLDSELHRHGAHRKGKLPAIGVEIVEIPEGADPHMICMALAASGKFKAVEVDEEVGPTGIPNDPQYPSQWHHPKIGSPVAWDDAQGSGVVIAILDTGCDPTHPDLVANYVPGYNVYDHNTDTTDVHGHGTSVAGTAAAVANNGIGVAGVSFQSKIMPMRIASPAGYATFSAIAEALIWAADHGALVANCSFGPGVVNSTTVEAAAQYMRGKGGLVCISGGNTGGLRTDTPSPSITSVAATDSADNRASFSSWGAYIDVAAPGVSVFTTKMGGGYGGASGTSFSSPIAAGVYGLMMSANPGLLPADYEAALFMTAVDLGTGGYDEMFGWGRVDAAAAVQEILGGQPPPPDTEPPQAIITSPTGGPIWGQVPVTVMALDNRGVAKVELLVNGQLHSTDTMAPYSFVLDTSAYANRQKLLLQARATDTAGNVGLSGTVQVMVKRKGKPVRP